MTTKQGPTTLRRRLRTKLRKTREARNETLDDVRKEMEWSISKLVRIENGVVNISLNDLRILLAHYGVTDATEIEGMLELARLSRQRIWANDFRDLVSQAYLDFMGYELDAVHVKQFHPVIIPGLLQTEKYARAIITGAVVQSRTEEEVAERVRMRMIRQQKLFGRDDRPDLGVVLDEAAVRRSVGGREVMREQLSHLIDITRDEKVSLHVIPLSVDSHPGLSGPFSLLQFDSPEDADVVYLENAAPGDVALNDDPIDVAGYASRFTDLVKVSLDSNQVVPFLEKLVKDLA